MTFIIILLILLIICLYFVFTSKKTTKNTVHCYTGGLGSGKSFMAVKDAISYCKTQNLLYVLSRFPILHFFLGKRFRCYIYSNIPIVVARKYIFFGKKIFSRVLTKNHLLLKERLPENSCVLIDEIGQFASQWEFDNPYIMEYLQEFIRFYRHYINGLLVLTDQCSANIVVPLRRRISVIYSLSNFHRLFGFMPMYKIDVQELTVTDEQIENVNTMDIDTRKEFFFGFLHYKLISRLFKLYKYDSRCYSIMYMGDKSYNPPEEWTELKTNYLIDIYATGDQKKAYKKARILPE